MKTFLDNIGINKDDEKFIKNVKQNLFEMNYDNLMYIVSKMGLADTLNEEIRKAPSTYSDKEKTNFTTKKALELLSNKVPQEIKDDIKDTLVNKNKYKLDKYGGNEDELITYYSLQSLLFTRFTSNNVFNRVFDSNVKNMYESNKKIVISWMCGALKDRWDKEVRNSPYKDERDGIIFSAESEDKLDELLEYYSNIKDKNNDVTATIFFKKFNNDKPIITNTIVEDGRCFQREGVVYLDKKTIQNNNPLAMYHELTHFIDGRKKDNSYNELHNIVKIIRNDYRLDHYKDSIEEAARYNNLYEETAEIAAIYDALYEGKLATFSGFAGHGVEYFKHPGYAEKEILANVGELILSGRESTLFDHLPSEHAESLVDAYYKIVFDTDKVFSDIDNSLQSVDKLNAVINYLSSKESGPNIDKDDYLRLYMVHPKTISKYFNAMKELDGDYVRNLTRSLKKDDGEIDDPNTKKYVDLMGKDRAIMVLEHYLKVRDFAYIRK